MVWCTPAYPLLNHYPKLFWHFWKMILFCPIFIWKSRFSHYGAMKGKNNMIFFFFFFYFFYWFIYLPTYPAKKYRVGVQQTKNCLRVVQVFFQMKILWAHTVYTFNIYWFSSLISGFMLAMLKAGHQIMRHNYKSRSTDNFNPFCSLLFYSYLQLFSVWDHGYTVSFEQLCN